MKPITCFAFLILSLVAHACYGDVLHGRIEAPAGTPLETLRILYFDQRFSEVENDGHAPQLTASVDAQGLFEIAVTSPSLNANLEILGEGVRRARFAWPADLAQSSGSEGLASRAVFRLDRGAAANVIVLDAATGAPISNALIGPVTPDEHVNVKELDRVYPFFQRTDAEGRARILGLMPEVGYAANIFAPGYLRRHVALSQQDDLRIELTPGGVSIAGEVRGHASSQVYPGVVVALSGGPQNLYVLRRAGERGEFEFQGLSPGAYRLQPQTPGRGVTMPMEVDLPATGLKGVWLAYPEGIVVSGRVFDIETGEAVRGVVVHLAESTAAAGEDGRFEFSRMLGPWPASLRVEHPDYILDEDELNRDLRHPIDGISMEDVAGLEVPLRRRRVMIVDWAGWSRDEPPAALEVWGPVETEADAVERHRIGAPRQALPLKSAGTRAALLRTANGMTSDLQAAHTPMEATTTTLTLILGEGAMMEGSLTYEDGPPAPSFRIEVWSNAGGALAEPVKIREGAPNTDGVFYINALPPGEAIVRLVRPDGSQWFEDSLTLERGNIAALHRQVSRGHVLAGLVVDETGEARSGISLTAYGRDPEGNGLRLDAVSGDDGRFRFEGFGGAALDELRVTHNDYTNSSQHQIPLPDEDYRLELTPRSGITVALNADPATLESARAWLILAIEHMSPVGDRFWHFNPEQRQAFGGEERIRFAPNTSGLLCVSVEADGAWIVSEMFEWNPEGEPRQIELTPGQTGSFHLTLNDIEPDDVANLTFQLKNAALPPEAAAIAEAVVPEISRNVARFSELIPGVYHLRISGNADDEWRAFNLNVAPGRESRHALSLKKSMMRIQGVVTIGRDDPSPAAGAQVRLFLNVPESSPLAEETCDRDGRFAFEEVEAGRPYLLRASHENMTAFETIAADTGKERQVTARIALIPKVRVRLTAPLDLLTALEGRPGQPIVMMQVGGSGDMEVMRLSELEEERSMTPGRWRVMWGEDAIGEVEIPSNVNADEVADITLPSL